MSLLFADNVVLLTSLDDDLQLVLQQFVYECEGDVMRISNCKSEAMVLS